MGKSQVLIPILFSCSVFLNVFFLFPVEDRRLSWSRRAAEEAEFTAAISCSGHGRAYLDGLTTLDVDGKETPVCECNACFVGPDCSQLQHSCAANADGGDPYFLEPFWMQNAIPSAVLVSGWHRMSYTFDNQNLMSRALENCIRNLHAVVGNAITQGRHIVFGVGTAQLLNAAIHALSPQNSSSPARVVASIPYYDLYETQTTYFQSASFKFEGDALSWKNDHNDNRDTIIEMVTSPNNPDSLLKKAVLKGPNVKSIHDRVYYWPHFTAISATPADDDIMLFSLSKLTGHAGTRFGWAVVRDEKVYQKMLNHVRLNTLGISKESQLRALQLIKAALDDHPQGDNGKALFEFGHRTLSNRWAKLNDIISVSSGRFSLQKIEARHCNFFKTLIEASPGYAWMKCEREEDKDCYAVLEAANIIGRRGSRFGAEERFVRLSLLKSDDDFDLLLHRLNELVSREYETGQTF